MPCTLEQRPSDCLEQGGFYKMANALSTFFTQNTIEAYSKTATVNTKLKHRTNARLGVKWNLSNQIIDVSLRVD